MGSWFFNLPAPAPDEALRFRKSVATPLLEIYLFPPADSFGCTDCAVSSVVEHYIDTVGVTGSNPVSRTTFCRLQKGHTLNPTEGLQVFRLRCLKNVLRVLHL